MFSFLPLSFCSFLPSFSICFRRFPQVTSVSSPSPIFLLISLCLASFPSSLVFIPSANHIILFPLIFPLSLMCSLCPLFPASSCSCSLSSHIVFVFSLYFSVPLSGRKSLNISFYLRIFFFSSLLFNIRVSFDLSKHF